MRALIAAAMLPLSLAACSFSVGANDQQQLEQSMRETLANQQINIGEVNLSQQADGNYTGYVTGTDRNGRQGRFNCTAGRGEGTQMSWNCRPTIDDQVLAALSRVIREQLGRQGEVLDVTLRRDNDYDRISGSATVRVDGQEVRLPCTATRDAGSPTGEFDWRCMPEGQ